MEQLHSTLHNKEEFLCISCVMKTAGKKMSVILNFLYKFTSFCTFYTNTNKQSIFILLVTSNQYICHLNKENKYILLLRLKILSNKLIFKWKKSVNIFWKKIVIWIDLVTPSIFVISLLISQKIQRVIHNIL